MKNIVKLFGIIALVALIGFSMASCGKDDDSGSGGSDSSLVGTWTDGSLTVTCTASTWNAVYTGQGSWSGSYTTNGNTATLTETNGNKFGTATISGNSMTIASTYGSFYLTKR